MQVLDERAAVEEEGGRYGVIIAPFLSCLVCDITFLARMFRTIRVTSVISQARQDKKGSISFSAGPRSTFELLNQLAHIL